MPENAVMKWEEESCAQAHLPLFAQLYWAQQLCLLAFHSAALQSSRHSVCGGHASSVDSFAPSFCRQEFRVPVIQRQECRSCKQLVLIGVHDDLEHCGGGGQAADFGGRHHRHEICAAVLQQTIQMQCAVADTTAASGTCCLTSLLAHPSQMSPQQPAQ